MVIKSIRVIGLGFILLISSILPIRSPLTAQAASCGLYVQPSLVNPVTDQQTFYFQIDNNIPQDIKWLKINRPSDNYSIVGVINTDLTGINENSEYTDTTLSGNSVIPANTSQIIQVSVGVGIKETSTQDWPVQASTNIDGSNPMSCSGTQVSTAALGYLPTDTPYGVTNVQATNVTDKSATVTWNSAVITSSMVVYDTSTDQYHQKTSINPTLSSTHSVTITGLKASTTYHFMTLGAGQNDYPYYSADSTFVTATPTPAPEQPQPNQLNNTTSTIGHTFTKTEKNPPKISLLPYGSDHSFVDAPTISGQASDDTSLFAIEYSINGGKDWLPVDQASGLKTKAANFSFTPLNLNDANYKLMARAIDSSGNIGTSPLMNLIIDRLPPLVGASMVSIGPQVLQDDGAGRISTLAGVDERFTLSAVGGPTAITLVAQNINNKKKQQTFSLTELHDIGLWSGTVSFQQAGTYILTAEAEDGAGNKTSKLINTVDVAAPATIIAKGTKKPVDANITVYCLEPSSGNWTVWDANAYGQQNPQPTDKQGNFNLFLPSGKFYLKVAAKGYKTLTSSIFDIASPSPVVTDLVMTKSARLLPNTSLSVQPINLDLSSATHRRSTYLGNKLIGQPLPDFSLMNTNGQKLDNLSLLGKPTVLSFMNTWAPTTSEQMPALMKLAANKDINVQPVALQENVGRLKSYDGISGYSLDWLSDPDSTTGDDIAVSSLPTHYFIDRDGIVKKVLTGVLTSSELLNELSGI